MSNPSLREGGENQSRPDEDWLRDKEEHLINIRRALQDWKSGSPSPRTIDAIEAGGAVFLMIWIFLLAHEYSQLVMWTLAIASGIAVGFYVYRRSDAPRNYLEHLDRLLADYEPVSKDALRALQEKVEAQGALDDYLVGQWLGLESSALRVAARPRLPGELLFLKKKI